MREAQEGNEIALRALLEPHVDRLWSLTAALLDDTDALLAIGSFQERLRTDVQEFSAEQAFGLQLYGALWRHLARRLDAQAPERPETSAPAHSDGHSPTERLRACTAFQRITFSFQLLTGLPAERLAELVGVPEDVIRHERSAALLTLVPGASADQGPSTHRLSCWAADDLPDDAIQPFGPTPLEGTSIQARVDELREARSAIADALFDRAPPGLLDLVHRHPSQPSSPPPSKRKPWLSIAAVGLFATALAWFAATERSEPTTDALIGPSLLAQSPGAWLDPMDHAAIEEAWALAATPPALRKVQRPDTSRLRPLGVVVLTDPYPGTLTILGDDQGRRLTWQVVHARAPRGLSSEIVRGVTVHHLTGAAHPAIAASLNGTTQVLIASDPGLNPLGLLAGHLAGGEAPNP